MEQPFHDGVLHPRPLAVVQPIGQPAVRCPMHGELYPPLKRDSNDGRSHLAGLFDPLDGFTTPGV